MKAKSFNSTTRTRGRTWMAIRARVLREQPLCVHCGSLGVVTIATEVDHIKPIHHGGTDSMSNLQGLCPDHHKEKTRQDMGWKHRPKVGIDGIPEGWT